MTSRTTQEECRVWPRGKVVREGCTTRALRFLVLLAVFLGTDVCDAFAQDTATATTDLKKYVDSHAGEFVRPSLERAYEQFLQRCGIWSLLKAPAAKLPDSVTGMVTGHGQLRWAPARRIAFYSPWRIFARFFATADEQSAIDELQDLGKDPMAIESEGVFTGALSLVSGMSGGSYTATCATALEAAESSKLAFVSISAEQRAKVTNNKRHAFAVSFGKYISPIQSLLSRDDTDDSKMRLRFEAWKWYVTKKKNPADRLVYVQDYDAVIAARSSDERTSQSLDGASDGSWTWLVDISGQTKASAESGSTMLFESEEAYLLGQDNRWPPTSTPFQPRLTLAEFESADEIATAIESVVKPLTSGDTLIVESSDGSGIVNHEAWLALPRAACPRTGWSAHYESQTLPVVVSFDGKCKLSVPLAISGLAPDEERRVTYSLQAPGIVGGRKITLKVWLNVSNPRVKLDPPNTDFSRLTPRVRGDELTWQIPATMGNSKIAKMQVLQTSVPTIVCEPAVGLEPGYTDLVSVGALVDDSKLFVSGHTPDGQPHGFERCNLNGLILRVKVGNGSFDVPVGRVWLDGNPVRVQ